MDHISAKLAFGGREKNIWVYKKLQGAKTSVLNHSTFKFQDFSERAPGS